MLYNRSVHYVVTKVLTQFINGRYEWKYLDKFNVQLCDALETNFNYRGREGGC